MRFIAHKRVQRLSLLLIADVALFGLTDAQAVPPLMLIVGFLLLAATIYNLLHGVLTFFRLYGLSIKRKQRLAAYATGLIAGLIALQSIGQLNSRDALVLMPLVLVGYLYSFYSKSARNALKV